MKTLLTTIIRIKRHGHGLDSAPARRASARVRVARPSLFTNFTSGTPLVHPLS
jgi:hypothetical protein